ncbi:MULTISPECIES: response regulator [unclassified Archaeoglobus]|jgi:CheY-like chemotaxis protein|uniref:response regulator n=1 Tax=unclassified Archaeoglobus TaxID=2643606 RepID=UPI0025C73729|nr:MULTISPECIES: response regulator [unclassified Archaeoglobus]
MEMERILLVEDNTDDIFMVRKAFQKAGIVNPLDVVNDGEKAIEYLRSNTPVIILLDLKLPKISGFEVLKWIKSRERLKRIPVIVLASSRNGEDINRAYDLGANSYITKPVRFEDLLNLSKHINIYWLMLNERPEV